MYCGVAKDSLPPPASCQRPPRPAPRAVEPRRVLPDEKAQLAGGERLFARALQARAAVGGEGLQELRPGLRQIDIGDALGDAGEAGPTRLVRRLLDGARKHRFWIHVG